MNQMLKRFLSLLLVFTMLCGMMVFPAAAEESEDNGSADYTEETEVPGEEEPSAPVEESTEPSEMPTEPAESTTEPSGSPTDPTEEATEPSKSPTDPTEEATVPSEAPTDPPEVPTEPEEEEPVRVIEEGGVWQLEENESGVIVIATAEPVTIIGCGEHEELFIDAAAQSGANLTLQDVCIRNTTCADTYGLIGLSGGDNVLNFEGTNVLEYHADGEIPGILCGDGLTLGGSGMLTAGVSGAGVLISGAVSFVSGSYSLAAEDAVISGETCQVGVDANVCISGNIFCENLIVTGGSLKTDGAAAAVNEVGEAIYLLTFDTALLKTAAEAFEVYIDGGEEPFYRGGLHPDGDTNLYFYLTGEDHTIAVNGESFTWYWDPLTENFYDHKRANVTFCVDAEDAQIIVSDGIGYTYLENTHTAYFFEAVEADEKASIEAEPAKTMFSLAPGEYTFTITCEGYYASSGSFKITEEGHAVSINTTSNINSYMQDDVFTIPMTDFASSSNPDAWDGVTLDVSWYSESAVEMHISTPAQLAGMAAIVNGIYNAEITTILDDMNGDGITESYTPYDYAHLDGRKIIAANSTGDTSGSQSNNLVTTDTYWYGAMSEGTFTLSDDGTELPLPADFSGRTVYIDCDLDMGGYQVDGEWTGGRYMTIGGQSLMHYIDYGSWMSDGYSHIGASFNGTLDGQGHIISNLYCDRYATGSNYGDSVSIGLVGRLGCHDGDEEVLWAVNPTVRNVAVTGYVYGRRSVGGVVGKIGKTAANIAGNTSTGGIIENCLNFCQVINTDAKGVGGICGAGWNGGVIRNCANFGSIYAGRQNGGGICGSSEADIINCYNVGYVDAITYTQGQAIGTDNGGAVYTNVYWLTGSSIADSVDSYAYPAVYRHSSSDTLTEMNSFEEFTTAEFLTALNGDGRAWGFAEDFNVIASVMKNVSFENCKLDTAGITAAGMPVPRCFISDSAVVTSIEKTADPEKLEYVVGQTFDPSGLVIVAHWSDGTSETLTDYTVSITRALELTDTAVTIYGSRGGRTYSYTYPITVTDNTLYALKVSTRPSSTVYAQGESFDPSGMVVKASYSAAPATFVALNPDEYTVEMTGNVVTVSYTFGAVTLTDSFEVTFLDTPAPKINADGYYELSCSNDLLWFANQVKAYKKTTLNAVVLNDMEVDGSFAGIGTSSAKYAGIFDGQGHTLTLNMNTTGAAGLFNYVDGAQIRNVTVAGSVTSSSAIAGTAGIAAYVYSGSTLIENCVNKATVNGGGYVGGLVGKTQNSQLTITGCVNEGPVTSSGKYVGGIGGYLVSSSDNEAGITVSDCRNIGAVASESYDVGGIAGYILSENSASNVTVTRCENEAAVSGAYDVGGIVGYSGSAQDRIADCSNSGNITAVSASGTHGAGGIAGLCLGNVENVRNLGGVTSESENASETFGVGGIVGVVGNHGTKSNGVSDSYNVGAVTAGGSAVTGAIAGYIRYTSVLSGCFYLESTANAAYGSVYGSYIVTDDTAVKTDREMKSRGMVELLNGEEGSAWQEDCGSYPALFWQDVKAHIYESVVTEVTCTEDGYTTHTCGGCGDSFTDSYVEAAGHHYVDDICDVCGAVDMKTPEITVTGISSTGKIRLSWTKVNGAAKYQVYGAVGKNGTYSLLTTVSGTSVTHGSAVAGKTYYYYIVALDAQGNASEPSAVKSRTCDLAQPVVTVTNVASSGKIKVSWKAVSGATKYTLNIYDSNGDLIKSVSTASTSLTHSSAVAGTAYTYQVRALCSVSAAASAWSGAKSRCCDLAQPVVTVSNVSSSGKIKVSWNAVPKATKYTLYIYDSNGDLIKSTSTTRTSLTHSSAVAGITYTYQVRALCSVSAAASAWSGAKSRCCDLARPMVSVSRNSSGKPVVSWAKVSGAVRYTVYIYDASGNLLRTAVTTGTKVTHSSAAAGTTYKYRVVAVHTNTAANSAKSAAVSVTAK